ncbi:hypothetical protein VTK56DRAFT_7088 [Thermocarpiscus australiensis]
MNHGIPASGQNSRSHVTLTGSIALPSLAGVPKPHGVGWVRLMCQLLVVELKQNLGNNTESPSFLYYMAGTNAESDSPRASRKHTLRRRLLRRPSGMTQLF